MICSAFQSISTQTTDSVSVSGITGIPYLHYGLKNEPMLLGMFAVAYTTRFCLFDPSANPATFFPLQLHRCRQWSCWMAGHAGPATAMRIDDAVREVQNLPQSRPMSAVFGSKNEFRRWTKTKCHCGHDKPLPPTKPPLWSSHPGLASTSWKWGASTR